LRQALQQLRDRYDELVNGAVKRPEDRPRRKPVDAVNGKNFIEPLETCWQREQRAAKRKLEAGGLGVQADELHAGILKWFESLIAEGATTPSGKPVAASNQVGGNHPTYGQLTRYQWSTGKDRQEMGLGLLLGTGRGMQPDLETKLKMISAQPEQVEMLIILWPRGSDLRPPIHENFPQATRAVWDKYEKMGVTRRVQLRSIAVEDVVPWLALPTWLKAIRTEIEGFSADIVHHFVTERTAALLPLVTPRS
jgi:hypothetical protein